MRNTASSSVQQARKLLADRLRETRQSANLSGPALANLCGWSKSKCSRIENAVTAPSVQDIRDWCRACNADERAEDLIASLKSVEGMFVEWRRMEQSGLKHAQEAVRPLFERTHRFHIYSPGILHGLIQTKAYTTALLRATQKRRVQVDDVDAAVQVRMERQHILQDRRRTFAFLLEEQTLHTGLAGPEIAVGQLRHLITVASLATISVGIIPRKTTRLSMPVEGFSIYDNAQVNVELVSGYLTLTQPSEVAMYAGRFRDLSVDAVYGAAARALIADALDALG